MSSFPQRRFAEAGANPEELARLQAEFDVLSPGAQQGYAERIAGLAQGDLAELIGGLRERQATGEGEEPVEPSPGPLLGVVEPPREEEPDPEPPEDEPDEAPRKGR